MINQLLTFTLIFSLTISTLTGTAGEDKDKNKSTQSAIIQLPVITGEDLEEIIADMKLAADVSDPYKILPQTYQVFDKDDNLIIEEQVPFDNNPSAELKSFLRQSDFLLEKGDLLIYKIM